MSHNAIFSRLKWIAVLLLIMMFDILPIPILGLILLYIIVFRPLWFRNAVLEIYDIKSNTDIGNAGLYVVLYRPRWLKKVIDQIYSEENINNPEGFE